MKKLISVLCVLALCFALCTPAFAEEKPYYFVLGDSIAKGSGLVNFSSGAADGCYAHMVAETNGYTYRNEAVDGSRSDDIVDMVNKDWVQAEIKKADIIGISMGGNNYLRGNLPALLLMGVVFRDSSVFDDIEKGYYEDLCYIIGKIKELNPGALIVMQTLYNPIGNIFSFLFDEPVGRINGCLYRYLNEHPGAFVIADVAKEFAGRSDCVELIHPTAKGNRVIAECILGTLAENGYPQKNDLQVILSVNSPEYILGVILDVTTLIPTF